MDKHIFLLIQKLWIIQDRSSPWAAKISLAPKPHQEHIFSIEDYEWRFCINYYALNFVTRPVKFLTLNCNDVVSDGFGNSCLFCLCDAYFRYHQFHAMTPYLWYNILIHSMMSFLSVSRGSNKPRLIKQTEHSLKQFSTCYRTPQRNIITFLGSTNFDLNWVPFLTIHASLLRVILYHSLTIHASLLRVILYHSL